MEVKLKLYLSVGGWSISLTMIWPKNLFMEFTTDAFYDTISHVPFTLFLSLQAHYRRGDALSGLGLYEAALMAYCIGCAWERSNNIPVAVRHDMARVSCSWCWGCFVVVVEDGGRKEGKNEWTMQ